MMTSGGTATSAGTTADTAVDTVGTASTTAPRLQVIVAHPDDESFGCGSLLLYAAASGMTTSVCCATRGEEGGEDAVRGAELGRIREAELREAAAVMHVSRVDLLDFVDSGMSGEAPVGSLHAAGEGAVISAVRERISDFRPDILVTLDASDSHRDHVRMRDATIAAAQAEGVPRVYLACLPRSLMRRWIDHMRTTRSGMEHLDADAAAMGTPDERITHRIDASAHLAARDRAMAVHASQTSPYDGLPTDLREAFLSEVHLQQVIPPWPGGPVRGTLTD